MILTQQWPWKDIKEKEAQRRVKRGERPEVPKSIHNSHDPVDKTLIQAMRMCHKQDPKQRATARQVETFLKDKLRELDPRGAKELIIPYV